MMMERTSLFFSEFIDHRSYKLQHTLEELEVLKQVPGVVLVKATTLYQIYKHNVFESEARLDMREFFRIAGQYFYYDKYVCEHGTEFYYYIVFNEEDVRYALTKPIVDARVKANEPDTLDDLLYIIPAVTKEEPR